MKKTIVVLLLVGVAVTWLAGCSGMADGPGDRMRRVEQINDLQMRMLVDDWDYLWLYERNSRLTQYHPRVGG